MTEAFLASTHHRGLLCPLACSLAFTVSEVISDADVTLIYTLSTSLSDGHT